MTWSEPDTCHRCGAVVPTDAQWCGLCHASFAPEPTPDLPPPHEPPTATVDPLTAPLTSLVAGSEETLPVRRGKHAATATVPTASQEDVPAVPDADVDVMLAMLAAEHQQATTSSPLMGRLMPLVEDKGSRTFLIVGGVLAMTVVFFIVIAVLGLFT